MGCHIAKLVFYSGGFLISVVAGVEGGRMAEITELNAWHWPQKAGGPVPRKWRSEDDFLFNHSLSTLPHKLIFLTV